MSAAALLAAGQAAQGASSLVSLPFSIYGDYQKLKMDRQAMRETKKDRRFNRLLELNKRSSEIAPLLANQNRLYRIRNAG